MEENEDVKSGWTITFEFGENEHFEAATIVKEMFMSAEPPHSVVSFFKLLFFYFDTFFRFRFLRGRKLVIVASHSRASFEVLKWGRRLRGCNSSESYDFPTGLISRRCLMMSVPLSGDSAQVEGGPQSREAREFETRAHYRGIVANKSALPDFSVVLPEEYRSFF